MLTVTVQVPFVVPTLAGIVPPVTVSVLSPTAGVKVAPQVLLSPVGLATSSPDGRASVKAAPVKATLFSLVSVKVNVEAALTAIGFVEKTLTMEGCAGTPQPVILTLSRTTLGIVPLSFAPISLMRKPVVLVPVVLAVAVLPVYQVFLETGVKSNLGVGVSYPPPLELDQTYI